MFEWNALDSGHAGQRGLQFGDDAAFDELGERVRFDVAGRETRSRFLVGAGRALFHVDDPRDLRLDQRQPTKRHRGRHGDRGRARDHRREAPQRRFLFADASCQDQTARKASPKGREGSRSVETAADCVQEEDAACRSEQLQRLDRHHQFRSVEQTPGDRRGKHP